MKAGLDVTFVARRTQYDALSRAGLRVVGPDREHHIAVRVVERTADARPADAAILAVKLYDLEAAAHDASRVLSSAGVLVGLQNGVDGVARMNAAVPADRILVGSVYSAARVREPGVVVHAGGRNSAIIGSPSGAAHAVAQGLVDAWRRAGVDAQVSADIRRILWTKFAGFATNAALTCLTRCPAGVVYHDPDLVALAEQSIAEVIAVAHAEGVELAGSVADSTLDLLRGFPSDVVASMRQDLDAGRPLELDGVSGLIDRLGKKHGVPTPVHSIAYACLKPFRDGVRSPGGTS